jgi:hypothetical protein
LKDLDGVEKKIQKTKSNKAGSENSRLNWKILISCKEHLEKGKSIRELQLDKEEKVAIA